MQFVRPLLQLPIRFSRERMAAEIAALGESAWTPHPQGFAGNDAVILVSPGGELNDRLRGTMAASPHLLNCPYIMAIMGELGGVWGRSRLMRLAPGAEVPKHVDLHYYWRTHIRIHIPIVTSPEVIFTCGGDQAHMAAGECWVFDSFQMHDVQNGGSESRVHLVLDTVGGKRLWDLIDAASGGAAAPAVAWEPGDGARPALEFEHLNAPKVMSPWEIRCHIEYLAPAICPGPRVAGVLKRLDKFVAEWLAAWSRFGELDEGIEAYRRLIGQTRTELDGLGWQEIMLSNDMPLRSALDALVFKMAVAAPAASGPAGMQQAHGLAP